MQGDPKGASVLILGAGVAGMVAALELRKAGYRVQVLEYNGLAGGRTWTIRGRRPLHRTRRAVQECGFDAGLYVNPGPWRISVPPPRPAGLLQAAGRGAGAVHPGEQQRVPARAECVWRPAAAVSEIQADFNGTVSELLAKAVNKDALNALVSKEDTEILLSALRDWGALGATTHTRRAVSPAGAAAGRNRPAAG